MSTRAGSRASHSRLVCCRPTMYPESASVHAVAEFPEASALNPEEAEAIFPASAVSPSKDGASEQPIGTSSNAMDVRLHAAAGSPMRNLPVAHLLLAAQLVIAVPAAAQGSPVRAQPPASSASDASAAPRSCNREAGALRGDKRRAFMSRCLAERNAPAIDRTRACQTKAGNRKGSERASFVRRCSASPAAA